MTEKFQTDKVVNLSVSHLVHDTYTAFLAPKLPLIINKLGIFFPMTGLLDVTRKIPSLFNPFSGLIADRICLKYLVIITPTISDLFMNIPGLASSYTMIFIFLFVTGISSFMILIVGILGDQFRLPYTCQICAVLALFTFPLVLLLTGQE